jgi:hypothetical protein
VKHARHKKTKLGSQQRLKLTYLYTMPAPVVAAFQYQYVLVGRFSDAQMQKGRERKEQSTEESQETKEGLEWRMGNRTWFMR